MEGAEAAASAEGATQERRLSVVELRDLLRSFTKEQILGILALVSAPIASKHRRNLASLYAYIATLPVHQQHLLKVHAQTSIGKKKRRRTADEPIQQAPAFRVHAQNIRQQPTDEEPGWTPEEVLNGPFMHTVSESTVEACIARSIDRTGNDALRKATCVACARSMFMRRLRPTDLSDIPNEFLLHPTHPRDAHRLTRGMLLQRSTHRTEHLCLECEGHLRRGQRPPLSLANNMWVGDVPLELSVLSLAERLLVSHYFPAAYIIKLFPRKTGRAVDAKGLNQALRGNVTSYRLNTDRIAAMVTGRLPHSSSILAGTIGVTFVGAKNRPLAVFPEMVFVQRRRVLDALLWLQANNPLYANVQIDEEALDALPENDVPDAIRNNARFSDDVASVMQEHATYVPADESDDEDVEDVFDDPLDEGPGSNFPDPTGPFPRQDAADDSDYEPDVFPIQASGVIDTVGDTVTDSDLFSHAAENIVPPSQAQEYGVRKGSAFVSEYARKDDLGNRFDGGPEDANHLLGAFPCLFPYGTGGFEVDRERKVAYEAHVQWALLYHDKRFRKDILFMFVAFSVINRRQMCRSAALQVQRSSFAKHKAAFQLLRPSDLIRAGQEEVQRKMITNPVVRGLRRQLTTVRAKVDGTDESRIAIRGQIWGMTLRFNPPTIWATLNLSDTGDPVAQVLAGEDINLDDFVATAGPMSKKRSRTVAGDPFAAAEFFHLMVNVALEELFGVVVRPRGGLVRREGILGVVNGYVGTVEAQARGSLHLHILFWLKGAPPASAMKAALHTEAFRAKARAFIRRNIVACLTDQDAQLRDTPKGTNIAYSRPEDPRQPNYVERRDGAERRIARATQPHDCSTRTCLRTRGGRLVCKRRAPWQTADDAWIDEDGNWGPKRVWSRMNAWNPALMQFGRCNQDMKLVTNGGETKDITFYITLYIAKKQIQAANASALIAKGIEAHRRYGPKDSKDRDENKLLLQRCANTLSRQHELSGPEVVSYLMGWGDRFLSHKFARVYWDEVTFAIRSAFPDILTKRREDVASSEARVARPLDLPKEPPARVALEDGRFVLKDQLKEYADRGVLLANMHLYDYHTFTYHGRMLADTNPDHDDGDADEDDDRDVRERRGRPPSLRVPYLPESNRKGCRIIRSADMETVVHLIGRWLPRADDPLEEYYCAQILALLKPWRSISDLRGPWPTFKSAFEEFLGTTTQRERDIIENLQYYHDCTDSADRRRAQQRQTDGGSVEREAWVTLDAYSFETDDPLRQLTEDDVEIARANRYASREALYGARAMDVAYRVGIFEQFPDPPTREMRDVRRATGDEMAKFDGWAKQVASLTRKQQVVDHTQLVQPDLADVVNVDRGDADLPPDVVALGNPYAEAITKHHATLSILNEEQRRAHDIIANHLQANLRGHQPPQLLQIVRGEGGTGKTVLINTISQLFTAVGEDDLLAKTATTGVAASLIGGQTIHNWAGIPIKDEDNPSEETMQKRRRNIMPTQYLVLDEYSMLTKCVLLKLSQIMGAVLNRDGVSGPYAPFGGVNVILFGDPHQFPPPSNPTGALYVATDAHQNGRLGVQLYHQFDTVITLQEQMRLRDPLWMTILRRLRTGSCTADDVREVESLLLDNERCLVPDFSKPPWDKAVLVTPRHGARVLWNAACVERHARTTGNCIYVSQALDIATVEHRELTLRERVTVAGMSSKHTGKLEERVELAVGMKAMVLFNIATEADLANGTRGEIVDIVLDSQEDDEPCVDPATGKVMLKYPPAVILFKPDSSTFGKFGPLPEGVLPIVPSSATFPIPCTTGLTTKTTIRRRQFALTPGYAFTDYKSQGQTLEYVVIDLEHPPSGKLTPFSAYVSLSRSRGRDNIRLLRGIDVDLFTRHPSEMLRAEDARLDALTAATARRFPARSAVNYYMTRE